MMIVKPVFAFLFVVLATFLTLRAAEAAPRGLQVGPVYIENFECRSTGEMSTCWVDTTQDLGGAGYRLSMTEDTHAMTPVLQLLPLAQDHQISLYFEVDELVDREGRSEGKFTQISVHPWND